MDFSRHCKSSDHVENVRRQEQLQRTRIKKTEKSEETPAEKVKRPEPKKAVTVGNKRTDEKKEPEEEMIITVEKEESGREKMAADKMEQEMVNNKEEKEKKTGKVKENREQGIATATAGEKQNGKSSEEKQTEQSDPLNMFLGVKERLETVGKKLFADLQLGTVYEPLLGKMVDLAISFHGSKDENVKSPDFEGCEKFVMKNVENLVVMEQAACKLIQLLWKMIMEALKAIEGSKQENVTLGPTWVANLQRNDTIVELSKQISESVAVLKELEMQVQISKSEGIVKEQREAATQVDQSGPHLDSPSVDEYAKLKVS